MEAVAKLRIEAPCFRARLKFSQDRLYDACDLISASAGIRLPKAQIKCVQTFNGIGNEPPSFARESRFVEGLQQARKVFPIAMFRLISNLKSIVPTGASSSTGKFLQLSWRCRKLPNSARDAGAEWYNAIVELNPIIISAQGIVG